MLHLLASRSLGR